MELSALRTIIQANWPTGFHSDDLTTAKVNMFINNALRWVCRGSILVPGAILNHNFSFLKQEVTRDTADQTQTYSLPTTGDTNWVTVPSGGTVRKFKSDDTCALVNSESYRVPLIKQIKRNMEEKIEFLNTSGYGIPTYYVIDGDYLGLYRIPDHAYNSDTAYTINLEFYGYLADLSDDDDSNTLTDEFPDVLEYHATAAGFRFGFDVEHAEYYENKAKERLIEIITTDQDEMFSGLEEGMSPPDDQSLNFNT